MPVPKAAQRLALSALSPWLQASTDPVYTGAARIGATVGILANRRMRQILAVAADSVGAVTTRQTAWRFGWDWWYQRTVDEVLTYQADRLTPEWAARHVLAPDRLPPESCVLVSIHQFNQHVAAASAVTLVNDLGLVSMVEPPPQSEPELGEGRLLLDRRDRSRAISRFHDRVFGERVFSPSVAARRGLELLQRGGSLIVLADFFGKDFASLVGKCIPVANGPIWWAERAGRPIVPFLLYPPHRAERRWRLWCGEPIPTNRTALVSTLEDCIRRLPTTWVSWRGWDAAPAWGSAAASSPGTRQSALRRV
jgi:hypothetical protein